MICYEDYSCRKVGDSVIIARDTRDKIDRHRNVDEGLLALGFQIVRTKLYVGDVALLNDMTVCIDLKQGLQECYSNIIQQHQRFVNECIRAKQAGIKLIILVEESGIETVCDVSKWINKRAVKWEKLRDAHRQGRRMNEPLNPYPPVSSERLSKAMRTISDRYGVEWRFCDKSETAKKICELLGLEV